MNRFLILAIISALLGVSSALYESGSPVKLLTEQTFPKMLSSKAVWMVQFFSPQCGHCIAAKQSYEKAAAIVEGVIHFGAVDMTKFPSLGSKYGIRGYPTFKVFAGDKNNPIDYQGNREVQDLVQFALTQTREMINKRAGGGEKKGKSGSKKSGKASSKDASGVIVLDDSNFESQVLNSEDAWFVEFYSPQCGHCIQLQPEWQKLPAIMKDKVKIAKIDATVNRQMASKYQIKGFPTIMLFPKGDKGKKVDYQGGRSAEEMSQWLNSQEIGEEKRELVELTQDSYNLECQKNNVCLVFLLKSKSQVSKLSFLKEVMDKHKSEPIHYLYTSSNLIDLQNDLLISEREYPKMLAIWSSSNSYRVYNGDLSTEGIEDFVGKMFGKRGWIRFSNKKIQEYLFGLNGSTEL